MDELFDDIWFRRQSDQIEIRSANESPAIRWFGWLQIALFQFMQNEAIDLIAWPSNILYDRRTGTHGCLEGPKLHCFFVVDSGGCFDSDIGPRIRSPHLNPSLKIADHRIR